MTVPRHIAVTPDGNRRWAKERGLSAAEGHEAGARAFVRFTELCARAGVEFLTIHAFSTDNWKRDSTEVDHVLELLARTVVDQLPQLEELGVQLRWAGRRDRVSLAVRDHLQLVEDRTRDNRRVVLTYCLDFGGRDAVAGAIATALRESGEATDTQAMLSRVEPSGLPDVDLYLRTSGEMRLSNNVLTLLAYAELFFVPTYWPDFGPIEFDGLLKEFEQRSRRFGGNQ